jgi:LacI family transcriptional regulator
MAFIKGQAFSSDTEVRWEAVREAAQKFGIEVKDRLTGQLEGESSSPLLGYQVTQKLLGCGEPFTALFTFNDISAIGATAFARDGDDRRGNSPAPDYCARGDAASQGNYGRA